MIAAILIGRKGSSGLPGKNTREIEGHPMVWWPLNAAQECPDVDRIYVSTDDPDIVAVAESFESHIIDRPDYLASDAALGEDAYVHAHGVVQADAQREGVHVQMYALLMANAVTVTSEQISEGIAVLRERPDVDSAVTVSCYNMWSPLRARRITDEGLLQPFVPFEVFGDPKTLNCDRDSQGEVWFADMGVSVVRPQNLEDLHSGLLPQKWMGQRIYPIKNEAGLDVDFVYQLPQAEYWISQHRD